MKASLLEKSVLGILGVGALGAVYLTWKAGAQGPPPLGTKSSPNASPGGSTTGTSAPTSPVGTPMPSAPSAPSTPSTSVLRTRGAGMPLPNQIPNRNPYRETPPISSYQPPPPPPPIEVPPPAPPPGPVHLTDATLPLVPGRRYLAVANVGLPGFLVGVKDVRKAAQGEGFTDVAVSTGAVSAQWPPHAQGDYYIEGTYSGPARNADRSKGPVTIIDAFMV